MTTLTIIATYRPWHRRLLDNLRDHLPALRVRRTKSASSLRSLDARALADIGIHASEISSIEGESRGPAWAVTRRRIFRARA
jgi:uncharacterized protein YjiS (DUF1127 family)